MEEWLIGLEGVYTVRKEEERVFRRWRRGQNGRVESEVVVVGVSVE